MIWNIVTDTSSDLHDFVLDLGEDTINFTSVPFIISVEKKDFIDNADLNVGEMIETMENSKEVCRTACPSPDSFYQQFKKEGNVIAVTISRNLSGSYNSASVAKANVLEEEPDKNIEIIDSFSAGPGLAFIVDTVIENIKKGLSFEEVVAKGFEDQKNSKTIFALSSFDNLVKNGRMNKLTGFIAQRLGFWGIGIASDIGTIIIKDKVRGPKKAVASIIKDMEERGVPERLVQISHCYSQEVAEAIKTAVLERWPNVDVVVRATRGLCSFYAERNGLIVAYL